MNTAQLANLLPFTDANVGGVYAADRVPFVWPKPCAIIANTDNHDMPGRHWIAMFIDRNGHGTYFDSFGDRPRNANFTYVLRRNSVIYEHNSKRLQSLSSDVCGQYCIVALHWFSNGGRLGGLQKLFTNNREWNDDLVVNMFNKIVCKTKTERKRQFEHLRGSGIVQQNSLSKHCIMNKF